MHIDATMLDNGISLATDICIIGAGAAGITLAMGLSDSKRDVLLLESGGFEPEPQVQALNEGDSVGLHPEPLVSTRLRYFGGTTNHWAGLCAPLDPIDFVRRDWIPHSGWPIDHDDLQPWYWRAQEICQLGPFHYEAEYWEQKTGLTRLPLSKEIIATKIIQFSPPTRFGVVYRRNIISSANITLWTHATVTNIRSNETASHVTDVAVKTPNGKKLTVAAKTLVLACGGLENPRILLLSNQTNRWGLGNAHDLVGRYFLEHPHVFTSNLLLSEEVNPDFYRIDRRFVPLFGIMPSVQRIEEIGNYSAMLYFPEDLLDEPPAEDKQPAFWKLQARIEQAPNPDSRITLEYGKLDSYGLPRISLNWQLTELDRKTIRVAETALANQLGKTQVGRLQMPDWLFAKGSEWPDSLLDGPHHMGTTRMSDSPQTGVVDANCKVHGVDNLYIAGSSVFATAGTANPTMTIVALAARLAQHIRENT